MNKVFISGNHAFAEAAIRAGCHCYFGYPITPQNELGEYMADHMRKLGRVFIQSESETAAINMVIGGAATGARVMTSSSSPGISLKQEGISFLAGFELPAVIVNVMRGGPGLGNIAPAQSDYYQATRGGGHGDYRMPVYAPASVQEAVELTQRAFDVADKYRTPVMILGDGIIGQMMEPVTMPEYTAPAFDRSWAATGWKEGCGRERAVINSLYIQPDVLEKHVNKLARKYAAISENETMVEELYMDDAEYAVVAYGTTARIALTAVRRAREDGVKVGLIRPVTVWPFPEKAIEDAAGRVKGMLAVEMSLGQMIDDVRLAARDRCPVRFYGRTGGIVPGVREIHAAILNMKEEL